MFAGFVNEFLIPKFRKYTYWIVNLFLYPYLNHYYSSRLKNLPAGIQLFFTARTDFGTNLSIAHYIQLWQQERGQTALVILTLDKNKVKTAMGIISPKTIMIVYPPKLLKLVTFLYRPHYPQYYTLNKLYGVLISRELKGIIYFEGKISFSGSNTNYCSFFDPYLKNCESIPEEFVRAYIQSRNDLLNYRFQYFIDHCSLVSKEDWTQTSLGLENHQMQLRKILGIGEGKYVALNIRSFSKSFKGKAGNVYTRRGSLNMKKFNLLIDYLISLGFVVVLQGKGEQPYFAPRKGFVDYSKSPYQSIIHDFALLGGSYFFISSKSGPENYASILKVPTLGLDYVELSGMAPNPKLRFYPKHLKYKNKLLTWKELLQSPAFFDLGTKNFLDECEYVEMNEEEVLMAVEEFLPLVDQPASSWKNYTPLQNEFKKQLNPLHMDLYQISAVPSDSYLKRSIAVTSQT